MIEQQLGFSLESFLRGIVGISTVLGVAYLMSYDRKRVDWKLVGGGLFMQFVFALAVLYVPVVGIVLEWVGKAFIKLMDFTQSGVAFLLGPLVTKSEGFIFLLNSLPVVIFFSALVSLFYYWGIIQRVVGLEVSKKGTIVVNEENMRSALPDVYAGGDIVRGGATVILAMGDGRKAAAAMDEALRG